MPTLRIIQFICQKGSNYVNSFSSLKKFLVQKTKKLVNQTKISKKAVFP